MNFTSVTELTGDDVTRQQVLSAFHRYNWASSFCENKEILEVACGSGAGLGLLASKARRVHAGDVMAPLVDRVRSHYGSRVTVEVMDAEILPFPSASLDVVIILEALYYVPNPEQFVSECRRVLRPGGFVLITNSNKDMPDFNPSPYSRTYHGVVELGQLFGPDAFHTAFFGYWTYEEAPLWQRLLLPVKKAIVAMNLMPKTMQGKKLLKRLVFGGLVPMPVELKADMMPYVPPEQIASGVPDRRHRVVYSAAQLR